MNATEDQIIKELHRLMDAGEVRYFFNPCCQMCKAKTPVNVVACEGCQNYQKYGNF